MLSSRSMLPTWCAEDAMLDLTSKPLQSRC
jgi:hypothetical protein